MLINHLNIQDKHVINHFCFNLGRVVVLEVPQVSRTGSQPSQRISSHVLCNHGNEIFMHSLNCSGKSNFEERPSIECSLEKLGEYRTSDFVDLIKANTFVNLSTYFDNNKVDLFIKKSMPSLICMNYV